jgi:hypothetical protein
MTSSASSPSLPATFTAEPEPASTGLQACRFATIMSTALTMSACVAHLMELPAKMRYEPSLYVRLHRTLYPNFGRTAGPAEGLAVAGSTALAWWTLTRRPRAFQLTAAAAGCLAAAHGIFWSVVNPVNIEMVKWPLDAIPDDWSTARDRWEYGHAVRAGLVTFALASLIASVLAEPHDAKPSRNATNTKTKNRDATPAH